MNVKRFTLVYSVMQAMLSSVVYTSIIVGSTTKASAQEIEPYDFVALPAGTNLAIGYYVYGHNTEFNVARGGTIKASGLEVNIGVARYVHYLDIAGHPATLQVIQPFGSLSAAHIDGQRLGSAFGAQNIQFLASIWPYVNTATKTNVFLGGSVNPPTGTYDRRSPINVGDNRWRGNLQLGLSQGITENLAFDLDFDTTFYGDNSDYFPGNGRLTQDPTYRAQVWVNWRWNPTFTTSIGYEGFFGGSQQVNGVFAGSKTEEHRIRANASLFLTPRLQTMLELNHDVRVVGGFKQDFGTTLRVVYVF